MPCDAGQLAAQTAAAAAVFAAWRRPWRLWPRLDRPTRWLLTGWAAVLAVMNSVFYLALDRLPLGTVAAVEFLPVVVLAAVAARTRRNLLALVAAVAGVYLLTDVRLATNPGGPRSPRPTRCCSRRTSCSDTGSPAARRSPASTAWVIPYGSDQLAMARLPRATYALMVSLLPATATVIDVVVLTGA